MVIESGKRTSLHKLKGNMNMSEIKDFKRIRGFDKKKNYLGDFYLVENKSDDGRLFQFLKVQVPGDENSDTDCIAVICMDMKKDLFKEWGFPDGLEKPFTLGMNIPRSVKAGRKMKPNSPQSKVRKLCHSINFHFFGSQEEREELGSFLLEYFMDIYHPCTNHPDMKMAICTVDENNEIKVLETISNNNN
jgi:hypothetical protein